MVNSPFASVSKLSFMATVPSPTGQSPGDCPKVRGGQRDKLFCNSAAGFNRCISKVQEDIQSKVRILHQELSKGKSVDKASQVMFYNVFYILVTTFFNQKVVLGKVMQQLCRKEVGVLSTLKQCLLSHPDKPEVRVLRACSTAAITA